MKGLIRDKNRERCEGQWCDSDIEAHVSNSSNTPKFIRTPTWPTMYPNLSWFLILFFENALIWFYFLHLIRRSFLFLWFSQQKLFVWKYCVMCSSSRGILRGEATAFNIKIKSGMSGSISGGSIAPIFCCYLTLLNDYRWNRMKLNWQKKFWFT